MQGALGFPIPVGCPAPADGLAGISSVNVNISCPQKPGSANGGMFVDVTNISPYALTLKSLAVLLPVAGSAANTNTYPLQVLYRRKDPTTCQPGLVCTGSVRDNVFFTNGSFWNATAGANGVVAPFSAPCNLAGPTWVNAYPVVTTVNVTGNGTMTTVPGTPGVAGAGGIPVAVGETLGFWFYFTDGTHWLRSTDLGPIAAGMGTAAFNNAPGDPSFAYLSDSSLRISAAMQATAVNKTNWGNLRPPPMTFAYELTNAPCPPPPFPSPPPAPPPVPTPPPPPPFPFPPPAPPATAPPQCTSFTVPTLDNQPLQAQADTIFVYVNGSSCPAACPPTYCTYGCLFCTNSGVYPGPGAAAQAAAAATPVVYGNATCLPGAPCANMYIGIRSTNCNVGNFSSGTLVHITSSPNNSVGIHTGNGGPDVSIVRFTQGTAACGLWADATLKSPPPAPPPAPAPPPSPTPPPQPPSSQPPQCGSFQIPTTANQNLVTDQTTSATFADLSSVFVYANASDCPASCPTSYCTFGCIFCANSGVFPPSPFTATGPGSTTANQSRALPTPIVYGNATTCAPGAPCANAYIGVRSTNCNAAAFPTGTLVRITNAPSNSVGLHSGTSGPDVSLVRFNSGFVQCGVWTNAITPSPPPFPAPSPPLPAPPCGQVAENQVAWPIPPSCPGGPAGILPADLSCPVQPGNANGGLLYDLTNLGVNTTISLTGISVLLPAACTGSPSYCTGDALTNSTNYALTILYRRRNVTSCVLGAVCTGSVRDNYFAVDGTYMPNATSNVRPPAAPAGNVADPSWVTLVSNAAMSGNGTVVPVPGTIALSIAPGEVVGMWMFFADGTKMSRGLDTSLPTTAGTTTTNNAPGDPTFSYLEDGYLRVSAAIQFTNRSTPNWGNWRPLTATHTYSSPNACPPPGGSYPPPPLHPPPPVRPPPAARA